MNNIDTGWQPSQSDYQGVLLLLPQLVDHAGTLAVLGLAMLVDRLLQVVAMACGLGLAVLGHSALGHGSAATACLKHQSVVVGHLASLQALHLLHSFLGVAQCNSKDRCATD